MSSYPAGPLADRSLPSTTWVWRKVILAESSAPAGDTARAKRDRFAFRARDRYKTLAAELRFRGGPEGSIIFTARGQTKRYPGYVALIDVLNDFNGQ